MSATRVLARPVAAPPLRTRVPRRERWRTRAATVLLAAAAVAASVLVLGSLTAAPQVVGLPDAGPVTEVGLVLARVAVRLLAVACVGASLLRAVLLPAGASGTVTAARSTRVAAVAAGGWAAAAATQALFQVSDLLAVPVHRLPLRDLAVVLPELPAARSGGLVVALAACAVVLLHGDRGHLRPRLALLPVGAALVVPQVVAGHASSAPGHLAAVTLLSVHVLVASVWVGGLVALVALAGRSSHLASATSRFSTVALGCFVLTAGTGAAGAWTVLGGPDGLLASGGYGALLAAKSGALVLLGAAGWWHRRRTLPALHAGVRHAFSRLAAAEVAVLLAATALAVALAGTAPAPAPVAAPSGPVAGPSGGSAAPRAGADLPAADPPAADRPADGQVEDMSAHDHGELSVGVLVDRTRFHVAGPVRPGQSVTVFNRSDAPVTLTAADGSFDVRLPGRTLTTFPAPAAPGEYPFTSTVSTGFADVLVVSAP